MCYLVDLHALLKLSCCVASTYACSNWYYEHFQSQPHKMVKHTQKISRQKQGPTNCLSVFDHFVGLALKGLTKIQFFFGSMWLLYCIWFFFTCKSFMLRNNKIYRIHGLFLLLPLLPEVWNFHARPENAFAKCFLFLFFDNFISLGDGEFAYRLAFGLSIV